MVYPPVGISQGVALRGQGHPLRRGDYFLYVGRLAKMKGVDLAIRACNELKLPLKIVGTGAGEEYLRSIAGKTIEFLGSVDDEQLGELYAGCKAVIFPAEDEDFGIVPVEAMGYGKPVIAHNSGGVRETVVDGKTGILFDELSLGGLVKVIKKFSVVSDQFSVKDIKKQAEKFSKDRFQDQMRKLVESEREKLNLNLTDRLE